MRDAGPPHMQPEPVDGMMQEGLWIRVRDFTVKPESGFVFTQCVKFTVKAKCVKCPIR